MKTKKWKTPKLKILLRKQTTENVLDACKRIGEGGPSGANRCFDKIDNCYDQSPS